MKIYFKVWNEVLWTNRVNLPSSQRMLDLVDYLSMSKDQARPRSNVWIMAMDPALSRMSPKNQVGLVGSPLSRCSAR